LLTRSRRFRFWLSAFALTSAAVFGISACTRTPAPPPVQVITDKGDPFGNLLVPKLQASVSDGAVGIAADKPVTVTAGDGVLGAVNIVVPPFFRRLPNQV
jgi:hypothetical protein